MKRRFEGEDGRRALVEVLCEQVIVAGNIQLADEIADAGEVLGLGTGDVLIEQSSSDNDVFLIIAGSCIVTVNGRKIAVRRAGTHVGEMAAIQPSQSRVASVMATEATVAVRLSAQQFIELADRYPHMWRTVAKELARRLEQRNSLVSTTHEKIRIFIMSSTESLNIAQAIQNSFDNDPFHVVVWTDGVFRASNYLLEDLEREIDQSDFAIAVASGDDETVSRGVSARTPRDNVVFELGFFMGKLGRQRAILVEPRGEGVKLPTDLSGLTTLRYKLTSPDHLAQDVCPVANDLRLLFDDLGPNN